MARFKKAGAFLTALVITAVSLFIPTFGAAAEETEILFRIGLTRISAQPGGQLILLRVKTTGVSTLPYRTEFGHTRSTAIFMIMAMHRAAVHNTILIYR
ncbi:MAG: hypothetical protein ACLR56_03260 [Oscillospiraceae bacterium]